MGRPTRRTFTPQQKLEIVQTLARGEKQSAREHGVDHRRAVEPSSRRARRGGAGAVAGPPPGVGRDPAIQRAHPVAAKGAQRRLHRVFGRMKARGKPANIATVAVARELTGFLWAGAVAD